ncbi:type 1 glutamine amidotransferase [Lysinimonas soli]|uniref:Lipid II isoglutaminyl synthase (glutamine-hydrolyzing) subunit GatD n=1 Tax=Lysinimonas soli TaxID=1074233 RepID=A0ABW0NP39_9MICO
MSEILQFFPERLDVNGDAQNALVLTQRARWAGLAVELRAVSRGDSVPDRPAAVVLGSSVDSALGQLRADLAPFAAALRDWVAAGVPLLAVGTGFELLSEGIRLEHGGEPLAGLGIFPGHVEPLAARATGDLVVDAPAGRLVGFENHARGYVVGEVAAGAAAGTAPDPLGSIVHGVGNGDRSEGARIGSAIGTHLHGPVLAKNPALADALLVAAFGDAYRNDSAQTITADGYAAAARQVILTRLASEPRR